MLILKHIKIKQSALTLPISSLMLLVANLAITKLCYKKTHWKMTETLAHWCPSNSTQGELSNEYKHDRVLKGFQKSLRLCALGESSLSMGRIKTI